MDGVTAMTDVTGFGLLGHLIEICEFRSKCSSFADKIKTLDGVKDYIAQVVPGGTGRNLESYGHKVGVLTEEQKRFCVILKHQAVYWWQLGLIAFKRSLK